MFLMLYHLGACGTREPQIIFQFVLQVIQKHNIVEIMVEAFYPLERGPRVFIDNDGAYPMIAYKTWSTREHIEIEGGLTRY